MLKSKGIITIAIGKKYAEQAKYLSLSCILNSPHTLRAVITDCPDILKNFYDYIIPYNESFGYPFLLKTCLYIHTPFERTLYIDSDSLVFNNIDSFFETLEFGDFIYNGNKHYSGIWYLDIKSIIEKLEIKWFPIFNSGMFLFNKSETAKNVFQTASAFMSKYSDSDISFFRNQMLPDEPFFAMAFAKLNINPHNDNNRFSRTLINAKNVRINILYGYASFIKENTPVFPLIVHFCGRFGNIFYIIQKIKLFFYFKPFFIIFLSFFLNLFRKKI